MKSNINQIVEKMMGKRSVAALSLVASMSMVGYAADKAPASPAGSANRLTESLAQDANGVVKGTVVDKQGEPLIGVSVKVAVSYTHLTLPTILLV